MALRILVMDVSRDSKRRSLADFATRSSSLESVFLVAWEGGRVLMMILIICCSSMVPMRSLEGMKGSGSGRDTGGMI